MKRLFLLLTTLLTLSISAHSQLPRSWKLTPENVQHQQRVAIATLITSRTIHSLYAYDVKVSGISLTGRKGMIVANAFAIGLDTFGIVRLIEISKFKKDMRRRKRLAKAIEKMDRH